MIYLQLFISFFKIGLFAIGGAYSFLPLTEKEVVEKYHWLTRSEFLDISGLVKMFPGAISVKYATYVGQKMGGIWGVLVANFANLLAPACFVLFAAFMMNKYKGVPAVKNAFSAVQLVVFAMIMATAFQTVDINLLKRGPALLLIVAAFTLFITTKIEPALIILLAGLVGAVARGFVF
jgi:chromate transporter